jgi:hypothetical protein
MILWQVQRGLLPSADRSEAQPPACRRFLLSSAGGRMTQLVQAPSTACTMARLRFQRPKNPVLVLTTRAKDPTPVRCRCAACAESNYYVLRGWQRQTSTRSVALASSAESSRWSRRLSVAPVRVCASADMRVWN